MMHHFKKAAKVKVRIFQNAFILDIEKELEEYINSLPNSTEILIEFKLTSSNRFVALVMHW